MKIPTGLLALALLGGAYWLLKTPAETEPVATDLPSSAESRRLADRIDPPSSSSPRPAPAAESTESERQEAIALARDPDGNLPQGEPVLPAPAALRKLGMATPETVTNTIPQANSPKSITMSAPRRTPPAP